MFQTAPGVTIPFPEKIQEQFQVYEGQSIRANISFEKLKSLLTEFYQSLPEPLFFVLQLPLSIQEERQLGHDKILHQEVCYLDGQTRDQMDSILNTYGQILLEDGMSQFAIASHVNHEEIFIQKYKLTDLYSPSPRRFIPLLQRYGLTETDHLYTVMGYLFTGNAWRMQAYCHWGRGCICHSGMLKEKRAVSSKNH